MSREHNHIHYTAGDIERYLSGRMSAIEMHALEKAALDDPFLAEAMEGYETMKETDWKTSLVALQEEMTQKGAVAKVIPLHKSKNKWWKAAAAVLLLGAAATVTFMLNRNTGAEETTRQTIAQTFPVTTDSMTPVTETPKPVSVTASLNPNASATVEDIKVSQGLLAQVEPAAKKDDRFVPDPNAPQIRSTDNLPGGAVSMPDNNIVVAPPPPSANVPASNNNGLASDEVNFAKSKNVSKPSNEVEMFNRQRSQVNMNAKKEAVFNNFFTAQVVTPDNSPLPFTNIAIKKDNFGTYADAKGMVRLVSTDSVLIVEVKSVGYLPKTFALRNNPGTTKIILQEDNVALNEKKASGNADVAGYRSIRRPVVLKDSLVNVEPADGWDNYNTYVANNLDIPEDMLKRDIHGEVELSFDVKANGTISNIRINKSLGTEYDEAARRLILEGPQWRVKKGRKTSASLKVKF